MKDRKRMKKLREKRIIATEKQIDKHKDKIENEEPIKDTTERYWKKETEEKFTKQIDKDNEYLGKH